LIAGDSPSCIRYHILLWNKHRRLPVLPGEHGCQCLVKIIFWDDDTPTLPVGAEDAFPYQPACTRPFQHLYWDQRERIFDLNHRMEMMSPKKYPVYRYLIFRLHALQQMFQRGISDREIRELLKYGTIIEEYADDLPYPSCLVFRSCEWSSNSRSHGIQ
jgi:hypothetical protein